MIYEDRKVKNKYSDKIYRAYFRSDYHAVSFILDRDFIFKGKQ